MKKKLLLPVLFIVLSSMLCSCIGLNGYGDEELAPVESMNIMMLESFPLQINVLINGYLPNPCYQITRIEKNQEGNTFYIKVFMKHNGLICIQTIKPYEETVALDVYGLIAGTYQIDVNGVTDSFFLDVDNILPDIE